MSQEILRIKKMANPIMKSFGVSKSFLFGSYARNESKKRSDIDFLIEFGKKKSLLDLVALKIKLEKAFKKKVDLVTEDAIPFKIKKFIKKDQIKIL